MISKCPVCKKQFDVLWPHLWAYKTEKGRYYCSWKCLRASEKKGEPKHMGVKKLLTAEQENHAVWLAISREDPRPYLAECGCKDPQQAWNKIRSNVKSSDPETFAKLPRVIGHKRRPKIETPEGVVKGPVTVDELYTTFYGYEEFPQKGKKIETAEGTLADAMDGMKDAANDFFNKCEDIGLTLDKEPEKTEFSLEKKVTGLMVEIGDFHYFPRTGYVDWTPVGLTEIVSLNTDEWAQVIRDLPKVMKELGAIK